MPETGDGSPFWARLGPAGEGFCGAPGAVIVPCQRPTLRIFHRFGVKAFRLARGIPVSLVSVEESDTLESLVTAGAVTGTVAGLSPGSTASGVRRDFCHDRPFLLLLVDF